MVEEDGTGIAGGMGNKVVGGKDVLRGRERRCIYRKDSSQEALRSNTGARREIVNTDQEDDRQPGHQTDMNREYSTSTSCDGTPLQNRVYLGSV